LDSIITFLPFVLLLLVCPLTMAALGVGAWLIARAKGQKAELSGSCMGGHAEKSDGREADDVDHATAG
jgi:hypothetical protein